MSQGVTFEVLATTLGGIVLAGGGAWAAWVTNKLIALGEDIAVLKLYGQKKLSGKRG